MPELAEVETFRRLADQQLKGERLVAVKAEEDALVFEGVTAQEIECFLLNRKVVSTGRHGKHTWLSLDNNTFLLVHFGMSGSFKITADKHKKSHEKLLIKTASGKTIRYCCPRRIGRIRLRTELYAQAPLNALGKDPYLALPNNEDFIKLFSMKKKTIKGALLDQTLLSGIGNWLADEILFQSCISPSRKCDQLSLKEYQTLRTKLQNILHHSVEVKADETLFPADWLFHVRWGKVSGAKTLQGELLRFEKIAGRTTAWVPSVQH